MTGDDPVDPDATPPYGIVAGTGPRWVGRTGNVWFVVGGVVVALILLTLLISLA